MAEEVKNQINEVNTKLDLVLQYVDQQRLKTQELEDLVKDLSIVGNDMFLATVEELEQKDVELDTDALKMLLIRLIKNVGNLNMIVGTFESMNDLMKDLGPILRSMSMDLIGRIAEFEEKGYFEIFDHLNQNADKILSVIHHMTQPEILDAIEKSTKVVTQLKMDDELDDKSLFKLYKEMKKPEVRKSISYSLRMLQAVHKELKS